MSTNSTPNPPRLSRREFLRVFSGLAVNTASNAVTTISPTLDSSKSEVSPAAAGAMENQKAAYLSHCLHCGAEFPPEPNISSCPTCGAGKMDAQWQITQVYDDRRFSR